MTTVLYGITFFRIETLFELCNDYWGRLHDLIRSSSINRFGSKAKFWEYEIHIKLLTSISILCMISEKSVPIYLMSIKVCEIQYKHLENVDCKYSVQQITWFALSIDAQQPHASYIPKWEERNNPYIFSHGGPEKKVALMEKNIWNTFSC